MDNVLIIAFDGLDKDLIEQFDLEHIPKGVEYGTIDNKTGMKSVMTSELFASFITGTTHDEHGVVGLKTYSNDRVRLFEDWFKGTWLGRKTSGLRRALYENINSLDCMYRGYAQVDLDHPTLFDRIPGAKSLFVPSYNPSVVNSVGGILTPLKYDIHGISECEQQIEKEHWHRKKKLFEELDQGMPRSLLMCHFHKADWMQHLYLDGGVEDFETMQDVYGEMDKLAAEIRSRAQGTYDTIVFMSDHGIPDGHEHNENAFYSSTTSLFGDRSPLITEFADIFLEELEGEMTGIDI